MKMFKYVVSLCSEQLLHTKDYQNHFRNMDLNCVLNMTLILYYNCR